MITIERTVCGVVLLSVLLPWAVVAARRRGRMALALGLGLGLSSPLALLWGLGSLVPREVPEAEVQGRPVEVPGNEYVTSRACEACHPREHGTWHGSYHRTMTQVVRPETVLGSFDGREVRAFGKSYRHLRLGDEFWGEMPDPGWKGSGEPPRLRKRFVLATGFHHMQAYWYETGDQRKIGLWPFSYVREDQRWVPVQSTFLKPPLEELEWKLGGWNEVCNICHSTGSQPRLRDDGRYDTRVAEFGIACEACHGPAEKHALSNHSPARRYRQHLSGDRDPDIVNPSRLTAERSSQVCGQCHGISMFRTDEDCAVWRERGSSYRPGADLTKLMVLLRGTETTRDGEVKELLEKFPAFLSERFWPDGMVRVSGREFNGLLRTPCFNPKEPGREAMGCLSCHQMHQAGGDARPLREWANDQLKPGMDGDEACLQCHGAFRGKVREHTRHSPASPGSRCLNCHMPYTTYGLLKAIRSHLVDTPSVLASTRAGRPNACNQCHLDRSLGWAADRLLEWYGIQRPPLDRDQELIAASVLWTLSGDAGQRALSAWSMGWEPAVQASGSGWMAPYLAQLMMDPYDAVRTIAYRSLRRLPEHAGLEYDFLWPESRRGAACGRIMQEWMARAYQRRGGGERVLIGPQGGIQQETWNRLFQQRNLQRVSLEE